MPVKLELIATGFTRFQFRRCFYDIDEVHDLIFEAHSGTYENINATIAINIRYGDKYKWGP